jgi:hypothetical protein
VTFSDTQSPEKRGIDWLAIVRILLAQVVVLFALSAAVVGYVNWSSDVAWKEFTGAGKAEASEPMHHSQSSTPVQRVRDEALCTRRA